MINLQSYVRVAEQHGYQCRNVSYSNIKTPRDLHDALRADWDTLTRGGCVFWSEDRETIKMFMKCGYPSFAPRPRAMLQVGSTTRFIQEYTTDSLFEFAELLRRVNGLPVQGAIPIEDSFPVHNEFWSSMPALRNDLYPSLVAGVLVGGVFDRRDDDDVLEKRVNARIWLEFEDTVRVFSDPAIHDEYTAACAANQEKMEDRFDLDLLLARALMLMNHGYLNHDVVRERMTQFLRRLKQLEGKEIPETPVSAAEAIAKRLKNKKKNAKRRSKRTRPTHVQVPDESPDDDCIVCFDPLDVRETHTLKCSHVLHAGCWRKWARQCRDTFADTTCPMCRCSCPM